MRAADTRPEDWVAQNASAVAVAHHDEFVVLPRREISSWLDSVGSERDDIWALVTEVRNRVLARGTAVTVSFSDAPAHDPAPLAIMVAPTTSALPINTLDANPPAAGSVGPATRLIDAVDGRVLRLELIRHLINDEFDRIDLLVSFIMKSGLNLIGHHLEAAIERGAQVRVLTTDYMRITDADALARLLDMAETSLELPGELGIRVFSDPLTSFHPKAYLFHTSETDLASGFVGSNNLSHSGIDAGVEWSIGTDDVVPLVTAFDQLWSDQRSRTLDHELLRTYRKLWRPSAQGGRVEFEIENEPPAEAPEPRPIQTEALEALAATRSDGFAAGMVVMATGLGKTWLAAFDSAALPVLPSPAGVRSGRTLFVAHREEILRQSRDVFRLVRPGAELGLFNGQEKQRDADVVFASVQTLARRLDEFEPTEFDYIVVDEFHHAAASSYRKVIDHFDPRFLLGLTATPERMDGADLMSLCGDNLVFECGLIEGIDRSELVPFRYWGIKDVADYANIPWRNGRFDDEELAKRIETVQRAQQAFDEWSDKCGERTLAFCASVSHAEFMRDFFTERGVRCAAVHSKPGSTERRSALDDLQSGSLQVLFSVDMFNEGVDVPAVDSVLLLRPTDSPVIFLQQLGRGLRLSDNKEHLTVVDFVGNHASFLLHPRTLLGLTAERGPSNGDVIDVLVSEHWDLPAGCSVVFDIEAIDLLKTLATRGMTRGDLLAEYVRTFTAEHDTRPSAAQAAAAGHDLSLVRASDGGWFRALDRLGVLEPAESETWNLAGDVLARFELENITKSYKLVTIKALLAAGALRSGMTIADLNGASQTIVASDPRLVADSRSQALPDPAAAPAAAWGSFWRRNPLDHLAKPGSGDTAALFEYDSSGGLERFVPTFTIPERNGDAFDAMVAEIVEWRLARYLLGAPADPLDQRSDAARCEVSHVGGDPIVQLSRAQHPDLPLGELPLVVDGVERLARFGKRSLKEMAALDERDLNLLPDQLRAWFGPNAGYSGTQHYVRLEESATGWEMAPERPDETTLERFIGQRFTRQQVRELFDAGTTGNWQEGHIPIPAKKAIVLFVTLDKQGMSQGTEYHDFFESDEVFVWTSQNSTEPTNKRGRAILNSDADGTSIHLFVRTSKKEPFEYFGTVTPLSHEGAKPMTVHFRLDRPATSLPAALIQPASSTSLSGERVGLSVSDSAVQPPFDPEMHS